MIRQVTLALLIAALVYVLVLTRYEGFDNPRRPFDNPNWAKLSDDQQLELMLIMVVMDSTRIIVGPGSDETIKEMTSVFPKYDTVLKNQSDIQALKNKIRNKASQDKNMSVLYDVLDSHSQDGLKLAKRSYAARLKNDMNLMSAIQDDMKALGKKVIQGLRKKVPDFPFNSEFKARAPEFFIEVPKPTASECKRFFKCSSIYAA